MNRNIKNLLEVRKQNGDIPFKETPDFPLSLLGFKESLDRIVIKSSVL